jgi:ribosomal protein L7/L12
MDPDLEYRIAHLEVQVRQIAEHLGLTAAGTGFDANPVAGPVGYGPVGFGAVGSGTGAAVPAEIEAALRAGKLIQAIQIYRGMTGMGLKESKAAVEGMARDLGVRY